MTEEAEDIVAALPAEMTVLNEAFRSATSLARLDHPEVGRRQACLVGARADAELQAKYDERRDREARQLELAKEMADPDRRAQAEAELRDDGRFSEVMAASVLRPRVASPLEGLPTTDDDVGRAVERLAATGVLERLGLVSERG